MIEKARMDIIRAAIASTDGTGPRVLVIGDSHAQDILAALYSNGARNLHLVSVDYRCQLVPGPRPVEGDRPTLDIVSADIAFACQRQAEGLPLRPEIPEADTIVLASRWKAWAAPRIADLVTSIRGQTAAPIVVFGPQAEFDPPAPEIVRAYTGPLAGLNAEAAGREDTARREVNYTASQQATKAGAVFVDKFALLCPDGPCPLLVPGTTTLFIWDYGHWTAEGAAYFGSLLHAGPLAPMLFPPD